jgi:hypothetical protein
MGSVARRDGTHKKKVDVLRERDAIEDALILPCWNADSKVIRGSMPPQLTLALTSMALAGLLADLLCAHIRRITSYSFPSILTLLLVVYRRYPIETIFYSWPTYCMLFEPMQSESAQPDQ